MTDYESKLTWFLVLLVIFLGVVNFQSIELAQKSRASLELEFDRRIRATAAFIDEKLRAFDLPSQIARQASSTYVEAPSAFQDLVALYGLAALEVRDPRGVVLLASERGERSQPGALPGARLDVVWPRLVQGESVVSDAFRDPETGQTRRVVYRPVTAPGSSPPVGILAVSFESVSLASLARYSTTLYFYQLLAFLVLLVLLAVFVRLFMRPYRALMRTARSAGLPESGRPADETAFVVAAFQETIEKLRDREEELRALHDREKSRADEQARLASHITRSMASGVVVFTKEGRLDFMNRVAEDVLQVEASSLSGATAAEVFRRAPDLARLLEDSRLGGEVHPRCDVELAGEGGPSRDLGASTFPILDEAGAVVGALALLSDLTEIKALQERMRLRENLAALGEMSAGIAHEFRNSLAAILGFASLLERRTGDAPDLREDVRAIKSEAEGLNKIVSEFLRFARPLVPERLPVELKPLISDIVAEIRAQPEFHTVRIDAQEVLPVSLMADELMMRQAIVNVVRNAAQAALANGPEPRVAIQAFRATAEARVFVAVADNGAGIADELRERVFLPFFTTREDGTGLGLAIVQKIVLAHDGTIAVDSRPGDGATFTLVFPVGDDPGAAGFLTASGERT